MIDIIIIATAVLAYGLVSRWISTSMLTGPMVFVLLGVALGPGALDVIDVGLDSEVIQTLLEGTLVIVLFTDAAVIDVQAVREHLTLPSRLLSVGLILTIAAGIAVADLLFGELGFWAAAVIAITLAPTDAALGQAVVTNETVPPTVRQSLSVESGLNDGIVVPLLAVALAGVAGEIQTVGEFLVVFTREVGVAVLVGLLIGYVGARLIVIAFERGWMSRSWRQIAVPTLAVLSYAIATPLDGSGFIAAFVGGLVFGSVVRRRYPDICTFSEAIAYLFTMMSFFVFGSVILAPTLANISWTIGLYALASLTVVRMVPVAISLIGSKLAMPTIAFIGWFGPRGLASLVFAGTVVAELDPEATELTITIIAATVGLSVILHGLTAWPLSRMYGRWAASMPDDDSMGEMAAEAPVRIRMRIPRD